MIFCNEGNVRDAGAEGRQEPFLPLQVQSNRGQTTVFWKSKGENTDATFVMPRRARLSLAGIPWHR
jgi:hypothetical protein